MATGYGVAAIERVDGIRPAWNGLNMTGPQAQGLKFCLPLTGDAPMRNVVGLLNPSGAAVTSGARPIPGRFPAYKFDGTDDYIYVPCDWSGLSDVIVAFWLYWDAWANDDDFALEYSTNLNTVAGWVADPNNAAGGFAFGYSKAVGVYELHSFPRPSAGAWHHYLLYTTRGGANNFGYVDAVAQSMTGVANSAGPGGTYVADGGLYLMSRAGSAVFGAGMMTDLRVYDALQVNISAARLARLLYEPATRWSIYRKP